MLSVIIHSLITTPCILLIAKALLISLVMFGTTAICAKKTTVVVRRRRIIHNVPDESNYSESQKPSHKPNQKPRKKPSPMPGEPLTAKSNKAVTKTLNPGTTQKSLVQAKKKEKLAKGLIVRRQSDYPAMNDMLSLSEPEDKDKDKEKKHSK